MRNKKEESKSVFKKKGFYAALYSCIGIVLVIAAVITYNARNNTIQSPNSNVAVSPSLSEVSEVNQSSVRSYLDQQEARAESTEIGIAVAEAETETDEADVSFFKPKEEKPAETPEVKEPVKVVPKATPAKEQPKETPKEEPKASLEDESIDTSTAEEPYETAGVIPSGRDGEEISSSKYSLGDTAYGPEVVDEIVSEPVFNIFGGTKSMSWPVSGDIVMDYSIDRTVYDKTLEQYRTNNSICISAPVGTDVLSAAEGVVRKVTNTRENGVTVAVDHGNGWMTTYSQLEETLPVAVGDVVTEGQVIGTVGHPSIYSVLLGEHLGFMVTKNDSPTDPKVVLK